MAEGEWRVRVCGGDRGACDCDCDYRRGGAVGDEDAQEEGCGWSEGQGCQDCCCQEDCYQDCEGLVCLFERGGDNSWDWVFHSFPHREVNLDEYVKRE